MSATIDGVVHKSTGSWYQVQLNNGQNIPCRVKGRFRIEGIKNTNPVAVGDLVQVLLAANMQEGTIVNIKERKNYIIRRSVNLSKQYHIIAANIDQCLLMASLVSPEIRLGFVDRFLVTAEAYNIPAIIVFNKVDLLNEKEAQKLEGLLKTYGNIGYRCISSSFKTNQGAQEIRELMINKTTLVSGNSGVGKTSLINYLHPGANLKTAEISGHHKAGMHTTTFAEMIPMPFGGNIIDTPGIKDLGL
ncbi:MAG: ribosome small subunit-dependent GTPase A, partial [Bacteroidales bacterium]|nr:ribosome small subunit-dependent GTPase A [Bacteroidales bacterium]